MDFEQQVTVAMRATAERVSPPVDELVRAGERRGHDLRRRRSGYAVALGGGVGVVAAALIVVTSGLGRGTAAVPASSTPSPAPTTCSSVVRTDALPSWASGGFSDPEAGGNPYVLGSRGDLLAVLFGQPLSAPEAKDHANKILWVSRQGQIPMAPLLITATQIRAPLDPRGDDPTVHRTIAGGPGPSYLDLPTPGCWHLDMTWDNGKQHDSMDLVYVKPAG